MKWKTLWRDLKNATIHRLRLGFNPNEVWSLDYSIARYTLPRIRYFRDRRSGYPANVGNPTAWYNILSDIIYFLEYTIDFNEKGFGGVDHYKMTRVNNGRQYFSDYFWDLYI